MSFKRGSKAAVIVNRKHFLSSIGLDAKTIIAMSPAHGTNIQKVDQSDRGKGAVDLETAPIVDGLLTQDKRVYLFLILGDCLGITLFDPVNEAFGLIHAGWRGLDQGIISKAIKAMQDNFSSQSGDLLVKISPSIGPCCYTKLPSAEQGDDPRWKPFITQNSDATFTINLWDFTQQELKDCKVLEKNIDNPKLCTYHTGEYFSNRQFQAEILPDDFRFAVVAGMR